MAKFNKIRRMEEVDYDYDMPGFPSLNKEPTTLQKVGKVLSTVYNVGHAIYGAVTGYYGKKELAKPPTKFR